MYDRDLRDHPGCQCVSLEDLAVTGQRVDAFLDAGAAGVVDSDDRCASAHGVVHHLGNFSGCDLREGTAQHGEVLGVCKDASAIDSPVADYD